MSVNLTLGTSQRAAQVAQILNEGIKMRDMSGALQKYGATLAPADANALASLTAEELSALQQINQKLAPLGIDALY